MRIHILLVAAGGVVNDERFNRFWENNVCALCDTYEMNP